MLHQCRAQNSPHDIAMLNMCCAIKLDCFIRIYLSAINYSCLMTVLLEYIGLLELSFHIAKDFLLTLGAF